MVKPVRLGPQKPYSAPKLTVYGTIRELTQKVGRHGQPDSGHIPSTSTQI